MVSPWHGTAPELIIAAVAVAAAAVAGYAVAGWAGLAVVAVVTAAAAMVLLRGLLPQLTPDTAKTAREKPTGPHAERLLAPPVHRAHRDDQPDYYDAELRPVLEHLLAARLAERHGVNLYQDPAAARRCCAATPVTPTCGSGSTRRRPAADHPTGRPEQPGIPRRTLARLIDRLEKL